MIENSAGKRNGFDLSSQAMKIVYEEIDDYAFHGRPCIFFGPTGAGKEFVAHRYYETFCKTRNPQKRPFKSVNCGGLSEELTISELFGHVKGAFSGAINNKPGIFEEVAGGVIFLDEIGDLPEKIQSMLLRALDSETSEARRLGANQNYSIKDVVVLCATEKPKNSLREALLNRLGHQVFIPGTDQRKDDIPPAVRYFTKAALLKRIDRDDLIAELADEVENNQPRSNENVLNETSERIAVALVHKIIKRDWPGNFREIRNAVDASVIRAKKSNSINDFIQSVDDHYERYLKNQEIIAGYIPGKSFKEPVGFDAASTMDSLIDDEILDKIRLALPNIKEQEKKLWAAFLSQLGERSFFRNELDEYFSNIKTRTIVYRLKALEKKQIIKRTGIRGEEYLFLNQTNTYNPAKLRQDKLFSLPDLIFTPAARDNEINEVLELLSNTRGVFISGEPKSGKTTFAFLLGKQLLQSGRPVFYYALNETRLFDLFLAIINRMNVHGFSDTLNQGMTDLDDLPVFAATLTGYLDVFYDSKERPVMILDNSDYLKSAKEIKALNIMLKHWSFFTFLLIGNKMGNNIKINEQSLLVEYRIQKY
jgi:transcriptional regulator with AAA-type ATPase domain